MGLLRKARHLPTALEVVLYLAASQLALLLPAALLLTPAVRRGLVSGGEADAEQLGEALRLARVSSIVVRLWPFRSRCLQRSLVVLWLLRRRGIVGGLRIGMHWDGPLLLGHAWVEAAGRPVNDTTAHCAEFTPLLAADDFARWRRTAKLVS